MEKKYFNYISEAILGKSKSYDNKILKYVKKPHKKNGVLKILKGNTVKGVIKISATDFEKK